MAQIQANFAGVAVICSLAEGGEFQELIRLATTENCSQARIDGMTPLMCAARANSSPNGSHATCADLLLTLAEDSDDRARMANASDLHGHTCLHHAADVNNYMVAEKLLNAGADLNKVDKRGLSALAVAVQQGSTQTVDLLMRVGADPEHEDDNGCSALKMARNPRIKKLIERRQPTLVIPPDFQVVKRGLKRDTDGRFADIFEVETKPPNLKIVLRVLARINKPEVLADEEHGLEALKKVRHVNVVQLIRFDISNSGIGMYLEDIDGRTIASLLKSDGAFIEVIIQKYFRQLVSALCYLHNHPRGPIIHRDISCRNIMLARDGVIKLIDFGLSLLNSSVCSPLFSITGTMCNMSPEIIENDEAPHYSRKSDIWATGCVLYAMAVGEEPFGAGSMAAIVRRICLERVPEPDPQRFSATLIDLYLACMRRNLNERISAVSMALHPFLNWDTQHDMDLINQDEIHEWARQGKIAIKALEDLAQNVNQSYKKEVKAKVGTTAAAVAGGITAIVGFALLIPSFGAALPLAIAGTSVAIAGGVGSATADIAGTIVQRKEFKKSQETIRRKKNCKKKEGANAEKADPIMCPIEIFEKILKEADDLIIS